MIFGRPKTKKVSYGKPIKLSMTNSQGMKCSHALVLNKKVLNELAQENSFVLSIFLKTIQKESREHFLSFFPEKEADILHYEKQNEQIKTSPFIEHAINKINQYCLKNCLNKQEAI